MNRRSRLASRPRLERLDDRCVLSAVTPAQLDAAYGLSAITFSNGTVKGTGEGQTIAIVDAYTDPNIVNDLKSFDALYNLSNPTQTSTPTSNSATSTALPSFSVVALPGATSNSGWSDEEALDVEMAHAAAPGANIVLVEAKSASTTDLIAAVNAAKAIAGVSVISMSWGGSEFSGEQSFDSVFTTPTGHTGITFIASAGDSGAGAEWPASSPNVVGVGGTSLVVTSSGARASEVAWSSSGGGVSRFESKPSYQSSVSGSFRSTPDVSLDADPNTGVVIVSRGSKVQVGGTSLGSPVFAGLIAIADQGLAITGKGSLDGATQTLPDLYKAPSGSFFDVTTGTTRAKAGFDTVTGLGSPNAPTLVGFLSGTSTTATTGGTTTGGTTSGGTTGGTTSGGTTGGTSGTGSTGGGSGTKPIAPAPPARPSPPPWGGWWWGGFHTKGVGQGYWSGWY